ncbi:MAG: ABC transporter permease subunit, partial [Actinomycetes bacterium]
MTVSTWSLTIGGFDLGGRVVLLGLLTGLTYGMLAIGLVLVYRSAKFINFAHIGIGILGAAVLSLAVRDYSVPYWPAMVVGMLVSAGAAVATDVVVVRPLRETPRILAMVATLGMAGFFFFAALALNPEGLQGLQFPKPTGLPTFDVDSLLVDTYAVAQATVGLALLVGLSLFLRRTRFGVAIRGAASNADAAALSGVSPESMSKLSWGLAGALACFSVALLIPSKGAVNPESIGPDLLLRALAAAAIARFRSFSAALVAALGIGVVEQVLGTSEKGNGYADLLIFAAVVVSLLLSSRGGREEPEPWGHLESARTRLPDAYRKVWVIRNLPVVLLAPVVVVAALAPLWMSNSVAATASQVMAVALVGVSVTVISGLAGQLSLGQFAIGGVAAAVAISVSTATGVFVLGLVAACIAGGVTSALIGIPALRVKGLFLAVVTLSFALVCSGWLLRQPWMLGRSGKETSPPTFELVDGASRNYYWVALAGLVLALGFARALRDGAFGRKLEAVRDNDDTARAFSVRATRVRIQAYVVAGMLAGLGGALYANSFDKVDVVTFPVQRSIDVVVISVIGGIESLAGPLLGAVYVVGIPSWLNVDAPEALAVLAAAWLIFLTYQPNGLAGVGRSFTTRLRDLAARWHGIDPAAARAGEAAVVEDAQEMPRGVGLRPVQGSLRSGVTGGEVLLEAVELTKRFGGLTAVDHVSFQVHRGETLGLIGPNGAGKTTLFELLSGFVRADEGRTLYFGEDITRLRPEERCRIGIVRSFQSATLFPTLSLLDTVMVARERAQRSTILESALGIGRTERARESEARAVIELFGLTEFTDVPVRVLPTGTRRLVELACTVTLEPRVILLDE